MRIIKNLSIGFASLFAVVFVTIYFFQKNISDSLKEKKHAVTKSWNNFNSDLLTRDSLLNSFISTSFDSLKYFMQKSILERGRKENDLDLAFYEYKINEYILTHFPNQRQITELNSKLNRDILEYNSLTKEYNVYISIFPNFIVAKRNNYKKAKYFTVDYGKVNEDPIKKSKELPEWAKGVDTT